MPLQIGTRLGSREIAALEISGTIDISGVAEAAPRDVASGRLSGPFTTRGDPLGPSASQSHVPLALNSPRIDGIGRGDGLFSAISDIDGARSRKRLEAE
jgi:hypothetical protein